MKHTSIWLANDVFSWHVQSQGGSSTSYSDKIRAYEMWKRAAQLLENNSDEFHRVDAISNLKRSLNQRLKFIEYVYGFKQIATEGSPKGYIEYLEKFGLVRPFMLKNILSIRNDIEHNDSPPPNIDRCNELADLIWYFLKSTDNILNWRKDDVCFQCLTADGDESQYVFSLRIDYELNYEIEISGWFPCELISNVQKDGHTEIILETMHTKDERWSDESVHANKLSTDTWLIGSPILSNQMKQVIVAQVLQAE